MDREEIYEMVFQEMMETAVRERNEHSKSVISSESAMLSDFISRRDIYGKTDLHQPLHP